MLKVFLLAPLPPPYGGISHWTKMVTTYSASRNDVQLKVINTAPTWRSIHAMGSITRIVGGTIQLLFDSIRLIVALLMDRPDVVHLTTSGSLAVFRDCVILFVCKLFAVPLVYHIHFGRIPDIAASGVIEWRLLKAVASRSRVVIVIDNASLLAFASYAPEANAVLVPNCIDDANLPEPKVVNSPMKTAIFLGWVIQTKGVGELVPTWNKLAPLGWRLDIVGPIDDEYKQSLLACIEVDSIHFHGEVSHDVAIKMIAESDLFVLPSYSEGFPNVVLEAMTLSKAIIATRVGAIPEMLGSDAGVLVEPRSKESLADALKKLMADDDLRKELGARAHDKAMANYTLTAIFERYLSIWEKR